MRIDGKRGGEQEKRKTDFYAIFFRYCNLGLIFLDVPNIGHRLNLNLETNFFLLYKILVDELGCDQHVQEHKSDNIGTNIYLSLYIATTTATLFELKHSLSCELGEKGSIGVTWITSENNAYFFILQISWLSEG